jgi:hypothetical protein
MDAEGDGVRSVSSDRCTAACWQQRPVYYFDDAVPTRQLISGKPLTVSGQWRQRTEWLAVERGTTSQERSVGLLQCVHWSNASKHYLFYTWFIFPQEEIGKYLIFYTVGVNSLLISLASRVISFMTRVVFTSAHTKLEQHCMTHVVMCLSLLLESPVYVAVGFIRFFMVKI